jgi:hypothetical protein
LYCNSPTIYWRDARAGRGNEEGSGAQARRLPEQLLWLWVAAQKDLKEKEGRRKVGERKRKRKRKEEGGETKRKEANRRLPRS